MQIKFMSFSDVGLLIKKIALGAVLVIVPSLILLWGIKYTQRVLTSSQFSTDTTIVKEKK